jgi:hypothetical protein
MSEEASSQTAAVYDSDPAGLLEPLLTEIQWNLALLRFGEFAYSSGRLHAAIGLYVRAEESYLQILHEVAELSDRDANAVEPAVTDLEGVSFRLSTLLLPLIDDPHPPRARPRWAC